MRGQFKELSMRSCALLLSAMFLLSGILHDRVHRTGDNGGGHQQTGATAQRREILPAAKAFASESGHHAGELCPVCAGLIQFFLAGGQVEIPLAFAKAGEITANSGIAHSAAPFFHQPRAPPVFPC